MNGRLKRRRSRWRRDGFGCAVIFALSLVVVAVPRAPDASSITKRALKERRRSPPGARAARGRGRKEGKRQNTLRVFPGDPGVLPGALAVFSLGACCSATPLAASPPLRSTVRHTRPTRSAARAERVRAAPGRARSRHADLYRLRAGSGERRRARDRVAAGERGDGSTGTSDARPETPPRPSARDATEAHNGDLSGPAG